MFFPYEILCSRSESLGKVWLISFHSKKLKRRDYEALSVTRQCDELLRHNSYSGIPQSSVVVFALRPSAHLMYGIAYLHFKQSGYLLKDVMNLYESLKPQRIAIKDATTCNDENLAMNEFDQLMKDVNLDRILDFNLDSIFISPSEQQRCQRSIMDVVNTHGVDIRDITLVEDECLTNKNLNPFELNSFYMSNGGLPDEERTLTEEQARERQLLCNGVIGINKESLENTAFVNNIINEEQGIEAKDLGKENSIAPEAATREKEIQKVCDAGGETKASSRQTEGAKSSECSAVLVDRNAANHSELYLNDDIGSSNQVITTASSTEVRDQHIMNQENIINEKHVANEAAAAAAVNRSAELEAIVRGNSSVLRGIENSRSSISEPIVSVKSIRTPSKRNSEHLLIETFENVDITDQNLIDHSIVQPGRPSKTPKVVLERLELGGNQITNHTENTVPKQKKRLRRHVFRDQEIEIPSVVLREAIDNYDDICNPFVPAPILKRRHLVDEMFAHPTRDCGIKLQELWDKIYLMNSDELINSTTDQLGVLQSGSSTLQNSAAVFRDVSDAIRNESGPSLRDVLVETPTGPSIGAATNTANAKERNEQLSLNEDDQNHALKDMNGLLSFDNNLSLPDMSLLEENKTLSTIAEARETSGVAGLNQNSRLEDASGMTSNLFNLTGISLDTSLSSDNSSKMGLTKTVLRKLQEMNVSETEFSAICATGPGGAKKRNAAKLFYALLALAKNGYVRLTQIVSSAGEEESSRNVSNISEGRNKRQINEPIKIIILPEHRTIS